MMQQTNCSPSAFAQKKIAKNRSKDEIIWEIFCIPNALLTKTFREHEGKYKVQEYHSNEKYFGICWTGFSLVQLKEFLKIVLFKAEVLAQLISHQEYLLLENWFLIS